MKLLDTSEDTLKIPRETNFNGLVVKFCIPVEQVNITVKKAKDLPFTNFASHGKNWVAYTDSEQQELEINSILKSQEVKQ